MADNQVNNPPQPQVAHFQIEGPQNDVVQPLYRWAAYKMIFSVFAFGFLSWQLTKYIQARKHNYCDTTVVVDQRGRHADFKTISAAIDAIPTNHKGRYCISIREGIYHESLVVPPVKNNVTFVGSGAGKTIISSDYTLNSSTTLTNTGNGFIALDLTIRRVVREKNDEGVAVENKADFTVFSRCHIEGYHAVVSWGIQFYRQCKIEGGMNLIYGSGTVVFQRSEVRATVVSNQTKVAVVANTQSKPGFDTGFVFHRCQFSTDYGNQMRPTTTYMLGAEYEYSRVVVVRSYIDSSIGGWLMNESSASPHVFFAVYQNNGPGATTSASAPMVQTFDSVDVASKFSVREFLGGERWLVHSKAPYNVELDL